MNDTLRAVIIIAIASGVTMLLRFLPFAIFKGNKKTPKVITYLGKVLPYAIMGMLVVYCLKDMSFSAMFTEGITLSSLSGWLPAVIATIVTVVLYVLSKKTLLGILGGTICYMALVQFVFV